MSDRKRKQKRDCVCACAPISVTQLPTGSPACPNGGVLIHATHPCSSGVVCNGTNGTSSVVTVTPLSPGSPQCAVGGAVITSTGPPPSTAVVCNGATPPPPASAWLLDGNTNGAERYIGTDDNFDFPIRTNGIEAARFTAPGATGSRLLIGQTTQDNGSSAGVQLASTTANQSQYRSTQYGANAGNPGLSTLKSRGTTVGTLAPLVVGDVIFGVTAAGVTANSSTGPGIPLSGLIQIVASSVPTAPLTPVGWIGTDYDLQLVSKNGPTNGRRKVFRINSEGTPQLYEQTTVQSQVQDGTAGLSTFDGVSATLTVLNANVSAVSRFTLTIQDGTPPNASIYVSSRVSGTSFTISSIGGTTQPAGVVVYWQIWEPVTQTP